MTEETGITRFLENPQGLVEYMKATKDVDAGFDYINLVCNMAMKLDGTLDIILPQMEEMWDEIDDKNYKGMTFYEATIKRTPLAPTTIQRHTRVGRMLEIVPEAVRPAIEMSNFKTKIQIANAIEDGYEINPKQWTELADAYYPQDVSLKLHEIKGTQPRSQFCKFEVDLDGSIVANTSKGRVTVYRPVDYDNPEIAKLMEWVRGKAERKLGVTPRIGKEG